MQINAVNDFAASPAEVHAMLTNETFLGEVCAAAGASDYRVAASSDLAAIERHLPAPSAVRRFVGDTLTTVEELRWQPPNADGGRLGTLTARVPGLPVTMSAAVALTAGGRGTLLTYTGDFSIAIPLLGRSLEAQAAPEMLRVLDIQQVVGDTWLAR